MYTDREEQKLKFKTLSVFDTLPTSSYKFTEKL